MTGHRIAGTREAVRGDDRQPEVDLHRRQDLFPSGDLIQNSQFAAQLPVGLRRSRFPAESRSEDVAGHACR